MAPRRSYIKNAAMEASDFRARAVLGFGAVMLALLGMSLWYFKLQVLDHGDYAKRSEANRIKQRPEVPARGVIYDRKGRVLAENVPAYRLDVVPAEAGDLDALIASLSKIIALTPEDIARFHEARKASRSFMPVTLRLRISDEEAASFAVDRWRYQGVELVPYLTRRYPYGDLFAHVVGYVGRIDKNDLEKLGNEMAAYSHTGKAGIERFYDRALRGEIGYEQIETNVDGRIIGSVGRIPAKPGVNLRLSVDAEVQRAATIAFGDLSGSAVALDPRTGEVLAMVSLPSYDANLFVNGISHVDYRRLMDDPARPLFNRNVLGGVAPGSTLKPLIALAGLDSGVRTPEDRVLSTGMFYLPGQRRGYGDSSRGGHGWTDLRKSIGDSVNTYYYKLALDMGIEQFDRYLAHYGFGAPTGIDLAGETGGILPSPEWKAKHAGRQGPWYPGDTVISSIGQGFWKATPLQLAQSTGALADHGRLRRPHLVTSRHEQYDQPWLAVRRTPPRLITNNAAHLRAVQEGMVRTVHGPGGTARMMSVGIPYQIAGKTGTAQVISRRGSERLNPKTLPMHLRHRALFIGYAPADNPTIALAVVVEGGGYGASTAGPIARKIFDAWLLGKMPEDPKIGNEKSGSVAANGAPVPDAANVANASAATAATSNAGASNTLAPAGAAASDGAAPASAPAQPTVPAPVPVIPGFLPTAPVIDSKPADDKTAGANSSANASFAGNATADARFPISDSAFPASR
jgi:penicillin-binding protein 2